MSAPVLSRFPVLRRVRLQHAMVVLCTVVVLGYAGSAFISVWRGYNQAVNDAQTTLERISRSAEVGSNRSIFEIDATLLGVERTLAALFPSTPLDDRSVKTLLRQFNDQALVLRDILIVDTEGSLVNTASSTPTRRRNYADQPFFTAHRPGTVLPGLFIGGPQRSRATGGWSVMISRPLMRGDDTLGVIAAEVPISVFADFFNSLVANSGIGALLLGDNGSVIAAEPHREDLIGTRPDFTTAITEAKDRTGQIKLAEDSFGGTRLTSFRRVPARPLIVLVSRERADILRQWRADLATSILAVLLFAVTAGCLTWLMVRALVRQQRATAELATSEERLKRQSSLLQSTLENMGEGLSVFDRSGRLLAWNSRFIELLGLPADLPAGTSLREILTIQAVRGDFGPVYTDLHVAERVERFYTELPSVRERLTGAGHILQIRRRAMPDGAVVTLYSDITERKNAEEKMAQAWAQAELANRSKSDFLANMSHELRTPLNAIVGFSEILSTQHLGPMTNARYLEYSNDIHSSGLHLLSIINDVLDMSKIEAGKLEILESEVEVKSLLGEGIRMVRERAQKQRVEMRCVLPDFDLVIWADERALKQALLNLLSNAVKFSHPGGRITVEARLDESNAAILTVADEGIGMTPDELERAMQPFGQAQSATTRAFGGTGLGLPITQGLVEAHGGALQLDSTPGRGTVASIRLPAERTRAMRPSRIAAQA